MSGTNTLQAQFVADAGFESPYAGLGNVLYDPTTSPWTFSGAAGLTGNASAFTAGNPPAPQGAQVAFLQGTGSLSQTVLLPTGTYTVSFSAAQRANAQASSQTFQVLLDGQVIEAFNNLAGAAYTSATTGSFSVGAGNHVLTIQATDLRGGDNTVFLDQVNINQLATLSDPGFETPAVGLGNFAYSPTTSPWTFSASAGVTANYSAFTAGNPPSPQGAQVAFLQGMGSLNQTASLAPGVYTIAFSAAQRAIGQASSQTFNVLVDGSVVGTFNNLTGSSYSALSTGPFAVTSGNHTVTFQATDLRGGDNTVFIDQVALNPVTGVIDPGFESPAVGGGAFIYNPSASPWTFSGTSGLTGNNSAFTVGNPAAPQGGQVAFLQGMGSVSQAISVPAGTYTVSFCAAQRAVSQASSQTFQVLIDGGAVGTFNTFVGNSYTTLTTGTFTIAGTSHVLTFQATDLHGGDNTILIDQVSVNLSASLSDPGFETPSVGAGSVLYSPTTSSWQFSASAGVSGNYSAFTAGNPPAPQGGQVAFLQARSSVSQTTILPAGTYLVVLQAAQRANAQASLQTFQVLFDGGVVGTFNNLTGTAYTVLTAGPFIASAGTHTVTIQATDLYGGDNTVFLDQVGLIYVAAVSDPGFETPAVGTSSFAYNPSSSPWTFVGGAGLAGNYSAFTAGNPPAPQGNQVAFLQGQSSLSQSVYLPAGTYSVSFNAAQRGSFQTSAQTFEVLIDGAVTGTFNNFTSAAYTALATGSFTVAAGNHTLTFQSTNLHGGDNTVFIDPVSVVGRVAPSLPPPTATFLNAGPVNAGTPVTVRFTGSAGGSGSYTYSYDFNDTGKFDIAGSSASQATVPGADLTTAGLHVVHGRITDSTGGFNDYYTAVQVNGTTSPPPPPPPPPGAISVNITGAPGYSPVGTPITLGSYVVQGFTGAGAVPVTPLAYAWSVTLGGSALASASTTSTFGFTPTTAGTYVVALATIESGGTSASGTATIIVTSPTDPLYRPVLNQNDFTYLGAFTLPHSADGVDTSFSMGGLTFRYDKGNLDFLTTAHVYSGGLVYEVTYPGLSKTAPYPQANIAYNWGDVYSGQKWVGNDGGFSSLSDAVWTYGLNYDQTLGRLYWNYGYWYNASNPDNPSFGYSVLNDATGVGTGMGAWSLAGRPEKFDRGGTLRIPQWFADRFTGGASLGVGFGGYFSIISSGSLGPALAAVNDPNPSVNPDDSAIPNIPLLGYPTTAPARGQRDPNYNSTYDGIAGAPDQPYPAGWNPSGGVGHWTWSDILYGAGTWIDLPGGKQGVLFIAKVGQGNVFYQSSDRHAQGGAFEWLVYNPADLAAVASGLKQQWQIQPQYEWTSSSLPLPAFDASGWTGDGNNQVGGITFDPTTNRLYVLVTNVTGWNGSEAWPLIYVFQVGPAVTSVTPAAGATSVSTSASITITFLTGMDATTFTPGSIVLRDSAGNAVGSTLTYNASAKLATLAPTAPLSANASYTVTVAGGGSSAEVKDLFGDPLAASFSWSFKTGL